MSPIKNPLKITDTTLRDGHQSNLATRLRTADMEPIAEQIDKAGFYSVEVWGGATFDVCTRFLNEDPWERVRVLKRLMPSTPLQMLLRGQNLVGYRNYPDDIVKAFIHHSVEVGIDIFRVFDALNDERNLEMAMRTIKELGKHVQACVCYSLTEPQMGGPVYNLDYFVSKARLLEDMGADSLCIKDMAGLIAPYDAFELVKALKARLRLPIQLHTHYTSGMAAMSVLKAAEAGVDMVDACLSPFALRSSQPAVESLAIALRGTERDTGLDIDHLVRLAEYFEGIAPKYRDFLTNNRMSMIDTEVLQHQVPGGMISNLASQLKEADALDRINEVYQELPKLRKELGYPPLVTPTSQIVGIQAVNNVLFGRYKMISAQVKDYVYGLYGRPPAPIDPEVAKVALQDYPKGQQPITTRAADALEPELEKAKEATKEIAKDTGDLLIYALYPTTGMTFLRWKYGLEEPPPEVRPKTMAEVLKEEELISKAKAGLLVERSATEVKPGREPLPRGPRARTFKVYVEGESFEVAVEPTEAAPTPTYSSPMSYAPPTTPATPRAAPAATPTSAASAGVQPPVAAFRPPEAAVGEGTAIRAPMPGVIVRYMVEVGQKVKEGDMILILEAMKMENALPSPRDGVVKSISAAPGTRVTKDQVLAIIE